MKPGLLPSTLVLSEKGYVPIADVKIGDYLLGADGNLFPVREIECYSAPVHKNVYADNTVLYSDSVVENKISIPPLENYSCEFDTDFLVFLGWWFRYGKLETTMRKNRQEYIHRILVSSAPEILPYATDVLNFKNIGNEVVCSTSKDLFFCLEPFANNKNLPAWIFNSTLKEAFLQGFFYKNDSKEIWIENYEFALTLISLLEEDYHIEYKTTMRNGSVCSCYKLVPGLVEPITKKSFFCERNLIALGIESMIGEGNAL